MGLFKKIAKKAGRIVTSKSKHTKKIVKVAVPVAAVAGAFMIGAPSLGALFASRMLGNNSEGSTPEPGGESFEDREAAMYSAYGGAQYRQQQPGFFSYLGSSVSSLFKRAPAAKEVAAAGAAGGSATMCADPALVTQALETVCRLCGG